ncbi:hypothetical protein HYPSUDRAFT_217455 [Hypholoma sublateritium FD-334 SS-4]|uniref:Uncharacterized protein n=1 Tax=Hypholoma sublateritium (strain FD-334 SS-4) TaxID=945553 RepID=A0A0D2M8T3_HYPSF|nr:hypothetical protein HYPSUDRAFT_217455 [Hypholoma sublateritium FD-334 SS-4]
MPNTFWSDVWAGVTWKALSSKEMFSRKWYLRRERLICYSLASLIGIAGQGAAEFSMFKYEFLQNHIAMFTNNQAKVHNNDIEAAGILSMVFPCLILVMLDMEYFRLLFWPGFRQPSWYITSKKATTVFCTFGMLATVIISTVVIARRSAFITGVDAATVVQLTTLYSRPPLDYKTWPTNIAWVVLLWIAMVPTVGSAVLLLYAPDQERLTAGSLEDVSRIASADDGDETTEKKTPDMSMIAVAQV